MTDNLFLDYCKSIIDFPAIRILKKTEMSKRNKHVVPREDGWAVKTAGRDRAASVHGTQAEAIDKARETARRNQGELFIHGRDGRIRDRSTYGEDPFPPRG